MFLKLITLFIFSLFNSVLFCQIVNLQSTSSAFKDSSEVEWSDFEATNALINMDIDNSRFSIYSSDTNIYTITENEGMTTNEDGDDTYSYYCTDINGIICRIRFMILHSQEEIMQLYIDYNDSNWVYNVTTHIN
jgi:hypothetical protein